jgi:hypothetical protein
VLKTDEEVREVYRQLESDLITLSKLVITHRKAVSEGDIRIASVILRKWFIDGLLGRLCNATRTEATIPALDNSASLAVLPNHPAVNYFLTAGIRFNGVPVRGLYNSAEPPTGKSPIPVDQMRDREMKVSEFLGQKRLYFEGGFFSCADIIKFTANKLGGAHFDTRREPHHERLERASQYMKYGGPHPSPEWDPGSQIYMVLEPDSDEVLSALHIEIIAAATSFIQMRFGGNPVVNVTTTVSLRTHVRRLLGLSKARFRFFGDPKPN